MGRAGGESVLARVARALRDAGVKPGDRLLLAVSGGPDSMVLLDVVSRLRARWQLRVQAAHVHHGLRRRSADRDAALVVQAAAARGLGVTVARLAPESRPRGHSLQMWARDERYRALESARRAAGAAWIVTAHTQNDQAETVLLNLLRGSGPTGLAGIPQVRNRVVRPLLAVSRDEVEAYAASRRVRFRRDPSNRSDAYLRNRVRGSLIPLLQRDYNPRLIESLAALAGLLREDETALSRQAATLADRLVVEAEGLLRIRAAPLRASAPALRRRVLQDAFRRMAAGRPGLTRRHLAALEALLGRGGRCALPAGLAARVAGGWLVLRPAPPRGGRAESEPAGTRAVPVRPGAWAAWPPGRCRVRVRPVAEPGRVPARGSRAAVLSRQVLAAPLSLRAWRPGDRFGPLGMVGRKKLQDFFVDAKVPRDERARVALLLSGERIAWVVGHRVAEEFRWEGRGPGCLAEVRVDGRGDAVPARRDAD
jgi:tRNA(Ile)-lysidine synthase